MRRISWRLLCILSFAVLVLGAAGLGAASSASAQTPIGYNLGFGSPYGTSVYGGYGYGGYGYGGYGYGGSPYAAYGMYPYSSAYSYGYSSPYITSYPFPAYGTYPVAATASPYSVSAAEAPTISSYGMYPSSSTPFSANGTQITGPDSCYLYDSWCAYCTNDASADLCQGNAAGGYPVVRMSMPNSTGTTPAPAGSSSSSGMGSGSSGSPGGSMPGGMPGMAPGGH